MAAAAAAFDLDALFAGYDAQLNEIADAARAEVVRLRSARGQIADARREANALRPKLARLRGGWFRWRRDFPDKGPYRRDEYVALLEWAKDRYAGRLDERALQGGDATDPLIIQICSMLDEEIYELDRFAWETEWCLGSGEIKRVLRAAHASRVTTNRVARRRESHRGRRGHRRSASRTAGRGGDSGDDDPPAAPAAPLAPLPEGRPS